MKGVKWDGNHKVEKMMLIKIVVEKGLCYGGKELQMVDIVVP